MAVEKVLTLIDEHTTTDNSINLTEADVTPLFEEIKARFSVLEQIEQDDKIENVENISYNFYFHELAEDYIRYSEDIIDAIRENDSKKLQEMATEWYKNYIEMLEEFNHEIK